MSPSNDGAMKTVKSLRNLYASAVNCAKLTNLLEVVLFLHNSRFHFRDNQSITKSSFPFQLVYGFIMIARFRSTFTPIIDLEELCNEPPTNAAECFS